MAAQGERNRVVALLHACRPADAVTMARRALSSEPDDAAMTVLLAIAYDDAGQHRDAIDAARRALALRPDDAIAYRTLGWSTYHDGDLHGGMEHLRHALELNPRNATTHVMLGELLIKQAPLRRSAASESPEHIDAIAAGDQHASEAIRLEPEHAAGYLVRAKACLARGNADGCRDWARQALTVEPNHPVGHQLLGLAAQRAGDLTSASQHFVTAGRLNPRSSTATTLLRGLKGKSLVGFGGGVVATWLALSIGGRIAGPITAVVAVLALWAALHYYPRWNLRRSISADARETLARDRETGGR